MTTPPALQFALNLGNFYRAPGPLSAAAEALTTIEPDGLAISSGLDFFTGYYATQFNTAAGLAAIEHVGPVNPQTLTIAELDNINLVAGEKLVIDYDYVPLDFRKNDFAFSMLKDSSGAIIPVLMGSEENFVNSADSDGNHTYPTHNAVTYTIGSTGSFDLMFGSSDAGDTLEASTLFVHSVSIEVPGGSYTVHPNGSVFLSDGSVLESNGAGLSSSGVETPSLLSGAAGLQIATLSTDLAQGHIDPSGTQLSSQAGGGLSTSAGNVVLNTIGVPVISNDGGSVISNDGGSLISQDGSGLISQDGSGLISQDGSGLIGEDASSLLARAGGGILGDSQRHTLSLDESGQLQRTDTNAAPTPPTDPAVPGSPFLVSPPASTAAPFIFGAFPHIAALTTGKFVVTWGVTQTYLRQPFGFDVQLMNADGTPSGSLVSYGSVDTSVSRDEPGTIDSVMALADGGFAVTYTKYVEIDSPVASISNEVYTQFFDASGAPQGGPAVIANASSQVEQIVTAPLSDGSFVALLQTVGGYVLGGNNGPPVVAQRVSASGVDIGPVVPLGPALGYGAYNPTLSVIGLANGAFATANYYPTSGDVAGPYAVIYQVVHADNSLGAQIVLTSTGRSPAMALLQNGNVVVAWTESDAAHAQILTPDGVKVGAEIVGPSTNNLAQTGDNLAPAVRTLQDGRFLLTFDSGVPLSNRPDLDGSISVQGQLYNQDGTPSGSVFNVGPLPATSALNDSQPTAAQLTNGTIEIAYVNQGASSSDILATPISVAPGASGPPAAITHQGRAVDGYISGATVFADANGNGVLDAGEASATTDSLGRYTFATPASGTVILTGGTDTSTGLAFTETLTAPAGSLTVTPLTTLIQKIAAANGGDVQQAQLQVNAEFGIAAASDLTALDPVRDTTAGYADGTAAFVDGAIVADTVALATAAGATGDLYGKLALQIAANPASFDVTSVAAMQALGLTGTAAADTSALAQASKALLTQTQGADTANGQALLLAGAAIEKIAQGATSTALNAAVATQTFDPVLATYTGANLAAAVSGAAVTPPGAGGGTPTLTGGGATATTDTVLGGDNVIRSIAFASAALASLAAPLLAAAAPATTLAIDAAGSYAETAGLHTGAVDDAPGAVTLLGNDVAGQLIAAGAAPLAFQGGSGGGTLVAGAGADSIYLPGGGSWNVALGDGADTVVAVAGNNTIATGTGGSFVFLGAGTGAVTSSGADTILGSTGSATVAAPGANSDELFALGGPLVFIGGSGASTVVSGAVAATLFGGAGGTLMFGDGATQYVGAGGTDTVVGLAGSMTVAGGAGGGLYFGGAAGSNVITAGAGNTTAFGGGAGDVLTATGSANDLFAGGVGAETLDGGASSGQNTFFAGFGPETLIGGAGNTALVAGAGADQLAGGSGLTLFLFVNGQTVGAADTISGFDPTHDFVKLAGYAGDEATTVRNATVAGGSSVIGLSDGTTITFAGVAQLNASSFT